MSALYNSALRQSKAIRADLNTFSQPDTTTNPVALQGQIATSLTSFQRTLDDYSRAIDVELIPEKKETGTERLRKFREDLLEFKSRLAELKHEREESQHAQNRTELLGRRPHTSQTPENPYADAGVKARAVGENVNPLFKPTSNPNFQPSTSNPYSSYSSPYGMDGDQAREAHALRENSFFSSANQTLDEYLERGRAVLGDLGQQRDVLKGTQRKLYSVGNTLGISGDTIRMVERRAKQDKWIFWGGIVLFIVFVYFVLKWFG